MLIGPIFITIMDAKFTYIAGTNCRLRTTFITLTMTVLSPMKMLLMDLSYEYFFLLNPNEKN